MHLHLLFSGLALFLFHSKESSDTFITRIKSTGRFRDLIGVPQR